MTLSPEQALLKAVEGAGRSLLVVTGAGVSLASGIPTFRGSDPDAVWSKSVTTMGTVGFFFRDPVASWRWYLERFSVVEGKLPNAAHHGLAALERWQLARGGEFLLVTQNVDCLHEAAGSRELVKVHGSSDRVRCSADGCENGAPRGSLPRAAIDQAAFLANPGEETLPRCPACGDILRQHVLWFDEYYDGHQDYQFGRVKRAAARAEVVLFVGTSFAVGVTDAVLDLAASSGAAIFSIDPANRAPDRRVAAITQPAEEVLPRLCAALGAG